jgi:hypothetical protein
MVKLTCIEGEKWQVEKPIHDEMDNRAVPVISSSSQRPETTGMPSAKNITDPAVVTARFDSTRCRRIVQQDVVHSHDRVRPRERNLSLSKAVFATKPSSLHPRGLFKRNKGINGERNRTILTPGNSSSTRVNGVGWFSWPNTRSCGALDHHKKKYVRRQTHEKCSL